MTAKFDPYHKWLAIPADEQPPNHYRLLGLQLFEADQEVIAAAAVQRMNFVRKFQKGEHTAVSQQIFKEVADAWACLLNPAGKQAYDAKLKAKIEAEDFTRELADIADVLPPMAGAAPTPPKLVSPPKLTSGTSSDFPPELKIGLTGSSPKDSASKLSAADPSTVPTTTGEKSPTMIDLDFNAPEPAQNGNKSKRRKKQSPVVALAKHAIASVVGLALGYGILCAIGRQYDFLGLLGPPPPESKATIGLARSKPPETRDPTSEIENERSRLNRVPKNPEPRPKPAESKVELPPAEDPRPNVRQEKPPLLPTPRLEVPSAEDLRKASDQVAQQYKDSFDAANSEDSKAALAKQLFSDADLARDDPARRYVLIGKSRELAIESGSFNMACMASAKLGQVFVVDGLELKAAALEAMAPAQVDRHEGFVQTAQGMLDEAAKAERFDVAGRLANLAATSIRNWNLSLDWPSAEDAAATFAETADALKQLASNRAEALASTRFGLFLELVQRNPSDAAKFLEAGGDATVIEAVAKDHGANVSPDAQVAAADAWWALSNQDDVPMTAATKLRAMYWYEKAIPSLSGSAKARAEGRALEGRMADDADDILMANELESAAKKRFAARDALRLYKTFLANAKVNDAEKKLANAKFAYWETASKEERVRLGDRWVFPAQAEKARADAQSLIDRGIDELVLKHSERAIPQLEHASQADPNGTQADFLLGVVHTTGLKNPQQGKIYFARASGRDSTNVGLLNNVAVAEFMSGDHLAAARHFQRATEINPRAPEVRHNLQRILQLASKGIIPQQSATAYAVRLESTAQDATKTFDRMGFLFVFPAAYALHEEQRPVDNPLMTRASELEISGRVGDNWVDDRDCVNCRGTGQVRCPDCQNGTTGKMANDLLIDRRITGVPVTRTMKVREKCSTCGGDGSVTCPTCHGGGTDTSIR
jgi:hypothetical protein